MLLLTFFMKGDLTIAGTVLVQFQPSSGVGFVFFRIVITVTANGAFQGNLLSVLFLGHLEYFTGFSLFCLLLTLGAASGT